MNFNFYLILACSFFASSLANLDCDINACNDLETAKACGKVRYCIDNVWVKQKPTGQSDSVCEICLRMVKEARDVLRNNETREELKQVLDVNCKWMILPDVKKECEKLMDKLVLELVDVLSSRMDPETVCTVSKLCNNMVVRFHDSNSPNCYNCQKFVRLALDNMTSITPEIFQQKLLYKCRSQGSFSDACSFYVTAYSDFIYNQTLQALKKNPCEGSYLCPTNSADLIRQPLMTEPRTDMCGLCIASTKALKKEMLHVKSSEDFKEVFLGTCTRLGLFQKGCDDLANVPAKKLHYMFKEKFSPKAICDLSYCTEPESEVPLWPLLPASEEPIRSQEPINFMSLLESFESFIPDEEEEEKARVSLSVGDPIGTPLVIGPIGLSNNNNNNNNMEDCKNCRNMFETLNRNLDADDNYVENVFTSVCNETDNFKQCQVFLNSFAPSLKGLLMSHLTSEKMCPEMVSSCVGETPATETKDFFEGSCSFCKKTFQSLRNGFDADVSGAKLGESFLKLCDDMPVIAQPICTNFISVFVNKTLPKVATEYSEDETCKYLKLCRNSAEATVIEPETAVVVEEKDVGVKDQACEICMLVVQTVIDQLKGKTTEDDIRKALNSVCVILPHSVQPKCHKLINKYTDQIVEMILGNLSAAEICAELNFCNKAQQNLLSVPLMPGLPVGPTPDTFGDKGPCRVCLMVMRMLIDQLQNDKTEDAIRKALVGICKYFPEETRETCTNLIGEYTEDVIDMIIADFNETEICLYLKLCNPKYQGELSWYKNPRPVFKTFDIATNEVREVNSPEEVCDRCQKLETSLKVLSDKNKTAEALLGFLIESCIIDGSEKYAACAEMVSKNLLPRGRTAFFDMKDICYSFEVCPRQSEEDRVRERGLAAMHSAVQECAMCEALVDVISTHKSMLTKEYDFAGNASRICSIVPRRNKKRCMSMLISYGPSIVNLIVDQRVEPDKVCYRLTLCDDTMQAKVRMAVSAPEDNSHDCLKGPSFWCANEENAKKCGTYLHCREVVWANGKPPQ